MTKHIFPPFVHIKSDFAGLIKNVRTGDFFMAVSKVEICGVTTSALPLLSEKEKEELMAEIKRGNTAAREKFIYGNLHLVLSVIQKFGGRGESADDLFQVGCIGLIKAIDNFDTSHMVKFSTYAVPMIIGELRRYLRDYNIIRVSRSVRDTAYKALAVKEKLTAERQKEPTVDEIAKIMEIPKEDVCNALDAIMDPLSLFEPMYHDGADAVFVMDQVKDDKNSDENWVEDISLKEAMKRLCDREKQILDLRFFRGKTQMEVADEIGISQAQVSRLEKSALGHMKKYL